MTVPIIITDLETVLADQGQRITRLSIDIAAYIRTIDALEAQIAELTPEVEELKKK